jgi:hypothetical protein
VKSGISSTESALAMKYITLSWVNPSFSASMKERASLMPHSMLIESKINYLILNMGKCDLNLNQI